VNGNSWIESAFISFVNVPHDPAPAARLGHFGPAVSRHAHAHLHVLWGYEGTLELEVDGQPLRVGPWQGLVIAPRAPHAFHAPRGARCFVVDSHDAAHAARLAPLAGQVRTGDASMAHLLRYLAAHPRLPAEAAELLIDGLCSRSDAPPAAGPRRPIEWAALEAWIDANLARPLSVATLAARVHLSPTHFAARCQQERGIAPMALVRRLRLASALRLRHAGVSVAAIAQHCGYRSPSALTAALRRDAPAA
jgi:AraC-like DNA-binding protein